MRDILPSRLLADIWRVRSGKDPSHALSTVVNVNSICNLRCSYCYISTHTQSFPGGYGERGLPSAQLRQVLETVRQVSHGVVLMGGEPFLRRDFKEILHFCKSVLGFVDVTVVTNGLYLKEKRDCLPYIDHLQVSYDMMRYRQYKDELDKLRDDLAGLAAQSALGNAVLVCTFADGEPLEPWRDILAFAVDNGLRIFIQPCRDSNGEVQSWDHINLISSRIAEEFGESLFFNNPLLLGSYDHEVKYTACIPRARLYVDVDGNLVYPCEKFAFTRVGNLVHGADISRLWEQAEQEYGAFPSEHCSNCGLNCYFDATVTLHDPLRFLGAILKRRVSGRARPSMRIQR